VCACESDALNTVAERILDQQIAAAGIIPAIKVTLPEQGHALSFGRALQIHPMDEMRVSFRAVRDARWQHLMSWAAFGIILLTCYMPMRMIKRVA